MASRLAVTDAERQFLELVRNDASAEAIRAMLASGVSPEVETEEGDTALILACRRGNVDLIDLLLEFGADVNHRNKKGSCPLIAAAMKGFRDICLKLLDKGADVNAETENRDTALSLATWQNQTEAALLLMDRGADITHVDNFGDTLLLDAAKRCNHRLMRALLERKIEVNHQNKNGESALHRSAEQGDIEGVRLLLDHNANPGLKDKIGRTPVMMAMLNEHVNVVRLLLQRGSPVDAQDTNGATPLTMMLELVARPGRAQRGYWDIVETLLRKGAPLNQPPKIGETLLSRAAAEAQAAIIEVLIARGLSPNATEPQSGRTPLVACIMSRHRESLRMAKLLLDKGADVNAQDEKGNTPLMAAAAINNAELCRLLLDKGAVVTLANKYGETALDVALKANSAQCIPLLSGGGPMFFLNAAQAGNLDELKKALEAPGADPIDVNVSDANGRTALMLAAKNGSLACVQYLLSMKARPDLQDKDGATALLYAIKNRNTAAAELLFKVQNEAGRPAESSAEEFRAATRFLVRLGTRLQEALDQQRQIQQLKARIAELEAKQQS